MLRRTVGFILVLLMASPALTQDLAALAKKEKERRAKLAKRGRVYTEADGKATGTGVVTILPGPSTAAPAEAPSTPPGQSLEEQKASWKARAEALRAEIWTTQQGLEVMEREFAEFQSDVAEIPAAEIQDPLRLQKREARLGELRLQLEQQRRIVTDAKKSLSALEDAARKSGIPPGWLR